MADARRNFEERMRDRARQAPNSAQFARLRSRAVEYVANPDRLVQLVEDAAQKSQERPSGGLGESVEDLKTLMRLALAYARGEYRGLGAEKVALVVAAIAYFLSPIDLIPDWLGRFGLRDDAVVLAFVMRTLREEIRRYETWETESGRIPSAEIIDVTPE